MRSTRERLRMLQNMHTGMVVKPSDRCHELETVYNDEVYRHKNMLHACATYCRGYIIISNTDAGMQCLLILMCFVGGATGFEVRELEFVCEMGDASSKWKLKDGPAKLVLLASLGFVQQPQSWYFKDDGHVTVLHLSCY